ncbi:MAG: DNA-binding response regulator [Ekhidna sp.]|nr:DNA-binding response regulator [Ekhidna sp.]
MATAYKILIVDDEVLIAEMCQDMLTDLGYNVIGIAGTFKEAVNRIDSEKPDLVILDINLQEEKNGTHLGSYIDTKPSMEHLYLTSHKDTATIQKAAATSPAAYLIKPFDQVDLHATVEVIKNRKSNNEVLQLNTGHNTLNVKADEVIYVKSDNNYIEVYVNDHKHIVRSSLDNFLTEAGYDNFIRIHRSYAINMLKVDSFSGQHVMLGEIKCPIARSYKKELLQRFSA